MLLPVLGLKGEGVVAPTILNRKEVPAKKTSSFPKQNLLSLLIFLREFCSAVDPWIFLCGIHFELSKFMYIPASFDSIKRHNTVAELQSADNARIVVM